MADIIQHPLSGNPAALLRLIDRRLLNPNVLLPARRSADGLRANVDCPWCGDEHSWRVNPDKLLQSRGSKCDVFDELFGIYYGFWFYIEGEVSEENAQAWFRDRIALGIQSTLADFPYQRAAR